MLLPSKWLERSRIWGPMEKIFFFLKKWLLTNPHHFLTMCIWDALSGNANRMKQSFEQHTKMFELRISAGVTEKLQWWQKIHAQIVAWSYDMEGHAQKMSWTIPWIGKEDSGATSQSFASSFGLSAIQTGRNWISWSCQKFARKLIDMLSWHELDVVTCFGQCTSVQDQSQTIGKVDFLHSSHEWQTPVVPRGEHSTACRLGLFQGWDFDGDFWGLRINFRRCLVYFWKQNICPR